MDSDPHRPREFVGLRPTLPLSTTPRPRRTGAEDNLAQLTAQCELLRRLFRQAPSFMAVLRGPEHVFELVNTAYLQLVGRREIRGKAVRLALPEMAGQASDRPHGGRGSAARGRPPQGRLSGHACP